MLPHTCDVCGEEKEHLAFSHLLVHRRLHTVENPSICYTCGKGFTSVNDFLKYKEAHAGEEQSTSTCGKMPPHICDVCGEEEEHLAFIHLLVHRRLHK